MAETPPIELQSILEDIRSQLANLAARVSRLEAREQPQPALAARPVEAQRPPALTEPKLLVISAAIAAYLGERVHIRQIRLVGSNIWAQQGRLFVQASHRFHHE